MPYDATAPCSCVRGLRGCSVVPPSSRKTKRDKEGTRNVLDDRIRVYRRARVESRRYGYQDGDAYERALDTGGPLDDARAEDFSPLTKHARGVHRPSA